MTQWKGYILTARAVSKSSAALRNELTRSKSAKPFCGEPPLNHPTIRDVERSLSQLLAVGVIRCLQSIQKTLLVLVKIFLAKTTLTVKVKETNLLNYIMYTNKWKNGGKRNDF